MSQLLPSLAFLLVLSACQPIAEPGAKEELILTAYDVPQPYAPEIVSMLNRLMWRGGETPVAGAVATISPTGQVLVSAPQGFHQGVGHVIEKLQNHPPSPPPSITMRYWLVLGDPAQTSGQRALLPPAIHAALDGIEKLNGPMAFRALDTVALTSLSGERADAAGIVARVSHTATSYGGEVVARLDINLPGGSEMSTKVKLPVGKSIVLGQAGYQNRIPGEERGHDTPHTLFTIIQASVDGQ